MLKDFTKGLFRENPVFIILIGLCPALAVTARFSSALAMGVCVTVVLLITGLIVSLLRSFIPMKFRLPAVLLIITAQVSVIDVLLRAFVPALSDGLGIYLPLIAVNCLVLGRAESFAFVNTPGRAALDGLGMGAGFTLALGLIALLREAIGSGTVSLLPLPIAGMEDGTVAVPGLSAAPLAVIAAPVGAFLAVGFLMGFINSFGAIKKRVRSLRQSLFHGKKRDQAESAKREERT
jgi:electron transport complex protein RnfE